MKKNGFFQYLLRIHLTYCRWRVENKLVSLQFIQSYDFKPIWHSFHFMQDVFIPWTISLVFVCWYNQNYGSLKNTIAVNQLQYYT